MNISYIRKLLANNGFCILFLLLLSQGFAQCISTPLITFTQPFGTTTTGAITITSPLGANYQYSIGGPYQANPTFTGVISGSYSVTYKDLTINCISPAATAVINPPGPTVSTVYLCQGSTAAPLTASPTTLGNSIVWYGTNQTGGTPSFTAPTPSTSVVGTTTYYVAQTNGISESVRVPLQVIVSAPASPQGQTNPFCDGSTPNSVSFDWSNVTGYLGYMYTYSIAGGPFTAPAFHYAPSNMTINTPGPGISVTFQILSVVGVPCAPASALVTCHSTCVADITPIFNPAAIKTSYCQGAAPQVLPSSTNNPTPVTGTWTPAVVNTTTIGTTTYTFDADDIQFPCVLNYQVQITVVPNVAPTFAAIPNAQTICQNGTAPVLPTTSDNGIVGTWNPTTINTAIVGGPTSYTFTPNVGQCASGPAVVKTVTIAPNLVPLFSPAIRTTYCQNEVTTALPLVTNNTVPITGTWNATSVNTANPGTTTYTFTPNPALFPCTQTFPLTVTVAPKIVPTFAAIPSTYCQGQVLGVPILPTVSNNAVPITGTWSPSAINTALTGPTTYTFNPTVGQCADIKSIIITVTPLVTPVFAALAPLCEGTAFTLPTTSNNIPPITGTWSPPVNNTATTLYTFTPTPGQCTVSTLTTLSVQIIPKLTPNFPAELPFCANTSAPLLSTTSPNGVDGTWSPAIVSNTQSGTYVFTPNTNQCAVTQSLTITVIPRTVPTFAPIATFCNGDVAPTLPLTSLNGITGTWSPAIIDNTISAPYLFTPDASECATTATLNVVVTQPITPDFSDIEFCSGTTPPLLPAVSPNGISGTWLPATIDNLVGGSYAFTPDAGECANPTAILVTVNEATLNAVSWTVSAAFEENQIVTVLASGPGEYLYQLDYGPFQESPVFTNVLAGTHSITVIDQNNCSQPITESDVRIINYPKYFTPNGDGFNDTWNIIGLEELDATGIFIFDRYGKLLKQISPKGTGWDGMYNGRALPSTDYWFTVEYYELQVKKVFKAHFALKR